MIIVAPAHGQTECSRACACIAGYTQSSTNPEMTFNCDFIPFGLRTRQRHVHAATTTNTSFFLLSALHSLFLYQFARITVATAVAVAVKTHSLVILFNSVQCFIWWQFHLEICWIWMHNMLVPVQSHMAVRNKVICIVVVCLCIEHFVFYGFRYASLWFSLLHKFRSSHWVYCSNGRRYFFPLVCSNNSRLWQNDSRKNLMQIDEWNEREIYCLSPWDNSVAMDSCMFCECMSVI